MGKTELLLLVVAAFATISLYNLYDNMEPHQETMFKVWADVHSKHYNAGEKEFRKGIWMKNYEYVQAHNARHAAGKETYDLEMNLFADLTSEEFASMYLMTKTQPEDTSSVTKKCNGAQAPDTNLPDSVDWSTKGTPIFNHHRCRNTNQEPRTMWFMLGILDNRISGRC